MIPFVSIDELETRDIYTAVSKGLPQLRVHAFNVLAGVEKYFFGKISCFGDKIIETNRLQWIFG